jgi:hypothetical protein
VPFPRSVNHIFSAFIALAERRENHCAGFVLTRKLQMDEWEEGLKPGLYDHKLLQLFIITLYPEEINIAQNQISSRETKTVLAIK